MTNSEARRPWSWFEDADGSIDIIDADGWHVCRMEDMGEAGRIKADMIVNAVNGEE
jgi:hypothetical protein